MLILKYSGKKELFRTILGHAYHFGKSNAVKTVNSSTQILRFQVADYSNVSYKDYYEVLGVSRKASKQEIKAQYIKLSKLHHPDTQEPEKLEEAYDQFIKIGEAYAVLGDEKNRIGYDLELSEEMELSKPRIIKKRPPQKDEDEDLTEEEKQIKKDEKNAMNLMRNSPVFRLLGYLYAFICIVGLIMWSLGRGHSETKDKDA